MLCSIGFSPPDNETIAGASNAKKSGDERNTASPDPGCSADVEGILDDSGDNSGVLSR